MESSVSFTYLRPPQQNVKSDGATAGNPQLLGVNLYFDAADPGAARITRVKPGSPALHAGLQRNDIILALIQGVWPDDQEEFYRLIQSIPGDQKTLSVAIEREGRLQDLEIDLWPPDNQSSE
ncbi:MAG: PDZ domain-containing protein [Planctomycetaceae bacterium]